jgi:alpha-galactosidase
MALDYRRIQIPALTIALVALAGPSMAVDSASPELAPARPVKVVRPLKVFILAGQSNMQGHAQVRTFASMADDPKTAPLLKEMLGPDGKPRVCEHVWISSVGCLGDAYTDLRERTGQLTAGFGAPTDKIGPEFTFGLTMEKRLGEPILIIKTAWGGRSLMTDFRPPSAGKRVFSDAIRKRWSDKGLDPDKEAERQNSELNGVFYHHMIDHVRKVLQDIKRVAPDYDPKQGYELAGFVWFQGFNDYVDGSAYPDQMKPGGYDEYAVLLGDLIRDVRKDLSAPKMPFVIGVMGIGGEKEGSKAPQMYFRRAQRKPATLPEFKDNVMTVETSPYWDDDLDELQQRMEKLHSRLEQAFKKDPTLTREARDEARKKAIDEQFKPQELARFNAGVSNGGYHYLGAAKILAPIGKAFADALPLAPAKPTSPAKGGRTR